MRLMTSAGGMPSSHSALVCAMAVAIAFREGLDSPLFALAAGVAGVVMYDAASIRRAAGHHASILNQIINELFQGHPISDKELQELLGHTPTQVPQKSQSCRSYAMELTKTCFIHYCPLKLG